jgi:hypothetical protein
MVDAPTRMPVFPDRHAQGGERGLVSFGLNSLIVGPPPSHGALSAKVLGAGLAVDIPSRLLTLGTARRVGTSDVVLDI